MFLMFLVFLADDTLKGSGYVEGDVSATTQSAVNDAFNGLWDLIVVRISSMLNACAMKFMQSFSPDMTVFLKMFGYTGTSSDFAAVNWTQAQDASMNLFGIFAVVAYILAIAILVISLIRISVANVIDTKDSTGMLIFRFLCAFLMITYSNSIVYFIMSIAKGIWDKIYSINDMNTAVYNMRVSSANGVITNIAGIDVSDVDPIVACIMYIVMIWNLMKLYIAVVEKYLIVCFMYLSFPMAASTFVSRNTEKVFQSFFKMLISELLMLIMNVWCVTALYAVMTHIGNVADMSGLTQLFFIIAFEKVSLRLEKYVKNLGLNNAVAGGNLLDEIAASGMQLLNFPGIAARSVRSTVQAANMPSAIAMEAAMARGDYAGAMDHAKHMAGADNRRRASADVMRGLSGENLSADQIAKLGISGELLGGRGKDITGFTAANALKTISDGALEEKLANGFGADINNVSLGDAAVWDGGAWHMRANVDGNDVGLKFTTQDRTDNSKTVLGQFTDSNGRIWNVTMDTPKPTKNGKINPDILKAADADGKILNPLRAEQVTGIKNRFGVRINPDESITLLNENGVASATKYVYNGHGGYMAVFDDSMVAKAMGMPTDSYHGFAESFYTDAFGNINDPKAAEAFTGVHNDFGMHKVVDKDGNTWYQPIHEAKPMRVDPANFKDTPDHNSHNEEASEDHADSKEEQSRATGAEGDKNHNAVPKPEANNVETNGKDRKNTPSDNEQKVPFDPTHQEAKANSNENSKENSEEAEQATPTDNEETTGNDDNPYVYVNSEQAYEQFGINSDNGIVLNDNGTYSAVDENGTVDDRQYLYNMDNPYGVEEVDTDTFRVFDNPDQSESHVIHLNPDNSYSNVDENGNVEQAKHIAEFGDNINVIGEHNGFITEDISDESYAAPEKTPVKLTNVRADEDGGYTATMTMRGLYVNAPEKDAAIRVRVGNNATKKSNERVISVFTPDGSSDTFAIFADKQDIGHLVNDSAGMTISNSTIGQAMMGMSERMTENMAKEHNINDDLGHTYVVDESGTTVSRMNKGFDESVDEDRRTGQTPKNDYDYAYGVVNTKYSDYGEKLYSFGRGTSNTYNSSEFDTPEKFTQKFSSQLREDEQVVDVKITSGKYADNIKVTIENEDTHERAVHTFRNVANLDASASLTKGKRYLKADGERWVEMSVKNPDKQKQTKKK